ncbi:disease resistance protein Pik-2-like [Aegilops tauschii subsp. strangulata]|uniref:Disease resistance protein RPM1 n=3 Tax=Aegilops tauschii TaxID=37682 RepID=A0A453ADM0_AEGTS|nr:disease resistance protein Pik-2-like [Aegilops tauschii subsp. strangulata]XP_045088430.1 disease resistance protein Pik-2-like [Aegilops tauschii subsp. strangulata]
METALVVSASQGAVRILLGKLGNILATKYALLSGVREEIQELKDELESMTGCLRDLADRDDHSQQTRIWMKQVREVAFDAEDCIDKFCRHLGQHPGDDPGLASYLGRIISLLRTMGLRAKLAAEITGLQSRAKGVSDRRVRYRLEDAAGAGPRSSSKSLHSSGYNLRRLLPSELGGGSGLVGLDGRTNEVVGLLKCGEAPRRVVSIVGFGGLGKTTLATAVYNSPELCDIQCRAFVAVSQTYDLRSLLESLLKQLVVVPAGTSDDNHPLRGIKTWGITEFPDKYTKHLTDKRYLIVLDDVWTPAAWKYLNEYFPKNEKQSRIIVTTRTHDVARNCSTHDQIYEMKHLEPEDSEKLFFRIVFESDECPDRLQEVSTAILKKCNGLPLVIVSIGRMLAQRENKIPADWQKVCRRLGPELETNPTLEAMGRILTLSYNDLPYNLKACFLYLCAFPEDYEIKRGPLIRRWAAEGFIAAMRGLSLEEIGQNYFDEFISRSLVTPGVISDTGKVKSCKIHDIMMEVITSKSVQENFMSFLGSSEDNITAGHDKIRRLSIHPGGTMENKGFTSQYLTHTRSLTIIGSTQKPAAITFSGFTLLRVLDLEGCLWLSNQDLKDICKLSLLSYLSLRSTSISEVPNAVGKLKELVTLDVRGTSVAEFPRGITKLQNLKHLMTGSYQYYTRSRSVKHLLTGVKLPRGLQNMCALQRISTIDINKSFRSMDELGDLSQLTRLYVVSHEAVEDTSRWETFVKSLNKLSSSLRYLSIQRLKLACQPTNDYISPPLFLHSLHLCGRVSLPPNWFSSLSDLASVSIRETYFGAELIEVLGKLPGLLSFKIYASGIESTETRLCFEPDRFPQLKQLVLDNPSNFSEEISFCGGATNLERLTLSIVKVPSRGISGINDLLKLREVEFFGSIVQSLVNTVMAVAREHQNHPRVTLEGQPTEDQSTIAQPMEDQLRPEAA